jgi:hypothetical protein
MIQFTAGFSLIHHDGTINMAIAVLHNYTHTHIYHDLLLYIQLSNYPILHNKYGTSTDIYWRLNMAIVHKKSLRSQCLSRLCLQGAYLANGSRMVLSCFFNGDGWYSLEYTWIYWNVMNTIENMDFKRIKLGTSWWVGGFNEISIGAPVECSQLYRGHRGLCVYKFTKTI